MRIFVTDFNLHYTLNSGQVFRWKEINGTYYGFIGRDLVGVRQEGNVLYIETEGNIPPHLSQIRHYFGLDDDLAPILDSLPKDPYLSPLIQKYRGLRIIYQDPWECTASFILSSMNNIKRIQLIVERLSDAFNNVGAAPRGSPNKGAHIGAPLPNGKPFYPFPSPSTIAKSNETKLRQLSLGYRAPYLLAAARLVDSGKLNLESLRSQEYGRIKEKLLECPGVGEKVAECILLFAYQQWQAFPVDVWIERLIRQFYFPRRKISTKRLQEWAKSYFGSCAGYAQQYFYCGTRV